MSFNDADLSILLSNNDNKFLTKDQEHKYDLFKGKDPFPEINSALLNSEDIIKYILTTGMIDPFVPENLQGATYTCTFSGTYLKYNSEGQEETKTLSDDEQLFIEPNSITYLEISEKFMVPLYMVLRFNLKVQHVYKGLLLGTGPIVDPGFVGRLYIPLHNLTTNKYCIKKGAELISVEFTKLSINKYWKILNTYDKSVINKLNFSVLPFDIQKKIPPNREISEYIKKSLQKDCKFHKEPKNKISVGSSLEDNVRQLNDLRKKVNDSLEEFESIKKDANFENKITLVGIIVAIAALVIPTLLAFSDIQKERIEYRDELIVYQEKISNLENSVTELIIENKKEHINFLKEEYDLFINKKDPKAIDIYNQITELEEEISELQEQLH